MRDERFVVVSTLDPAIETERMSAAQMGEYVRTRNIRLIEPFVKHGERVTKYHVREVPNELWGGYVRSAASTEEQWARCFQAGVERVENLWQGDGTFLPSFEGARELRPIPDEHMRRFRPYEIEEIGKVVWLHSFLARRIECTFALPHSCLAILTERAFLSVDASQTSQAQSSAGASLAPGSAPQQQAPTGPISGSTESGSGLPTGASATAMQPQASA